MGKVPVGQTLSDAFGFAFGRYFPILGVIWLPTLLLWAGGYFIFVSVFGHLFTVLQFLSQHPHQPPPPELFQGPRLANLYSVLTYAFAAWISIGVTKEALGVREKPAFVYLAVGKAELRLLGAMFLTMVFLVIGAIALVIVVAIVGGISAVALYAGASHGAGAAATTGWLAGVGGLIVLAAMGAMIYFMVRLMFLLAPATVAESRFALVRSWELSKGNFWRLFAISLVIALVMLAVYLAVGAIVMIPAAGALRQAAHAGGIPEGRAGFMLALHAARPVLPIVGLIYAASAPIFAGLVGGAGVSAYRSLVPSEGVGFRGA